MPATVSIHRSGKESSGSNKYVGRGFALMAWLTTHSIREYRSRLKSPPRPEAPILQETSSVRRLLIPRRTGSFLSVLPKYATWRSCLPLEPEARVRVALGEPPQTHAP